MLPLGINLLVKYSGARPFIHLKAITASLSTVVILQESILNFSKLETHDRTFHRHTGRGGRGGLQPPPNFGQHEKFGQS